MSEKKVHLRRLQDRIAVQGALTFATVSRRLMRRSRKFFAQAEQTLTVDLAGVSQGDSAGLAVLIEWTRWSRRQGSRVRFVNLPESLRGIAEIGEVSGILELDVAGEAEAPVVQSSSSRSSSS